MRTFSLPISPKNPYCFGSPMTGRTYSATGVGNYRFGFNGKERDDEINVDGGSYDFGARIYDGRLGRWLSVDPLAKDYTAFGSYVGFNNNPLYFADPNGKSGVVTIIKDESTGKNTIVVTSNVILYGGATEDQRSTIMADLNKRYNGATIEGGCKQSTIKNNYQTVTYENEQYEVQFQFNVTIDNTINDNNYDKISKNQEYANNYVRVTDEVYGPLSASGTLQYRTQDATEGSNSYNFESKDINGNDGTAGHELLHGYGGPTHPNKAALFSPLLPNPAPLGYNKDKSSNFDPNTRMLSQNECQSIVLLTKNVTPQIGPQLPGVTTTVGTLGNLTNLYMNHDMIIYDKSKTNVSEQIK